jgi:FKBP-type peptidyl-prolyl cis-trans isomerase
MLGMCVGERRKLFIPSEMGYGKRGAGKSIPRLYCKFIFNLVV